MEVDDSAQLNLVSHKDYQVKFHGYRIGLAKVEHALRTAVVECEGDAAQILKPLRYR